MTPEELAGAIVEYAADRKALDIVQLDLRGMIGYTDYFVICSGRSERQTKAIHDAIYEGLKSAHRRLPERVEGLPGARWILMDRDKPGHTFALHILGPHKMAGALGGSHEHVHILTRYDLTEMDIESMGESKVSALFDIRFDVLLVHAALKFIGYENHYDIGDL